jgi:hypothetical protein
MNADERQDLLGFERTAESQGPQRENAEKPSSNPLPFPLRPLRLGGEKNLTANLANDANLLEEE